MPLEAKIERFQRCTVMPSSNKFSDVLGNHDGANLEIMIEQVSKYTWSQ